MGGQGGQGGRGGGDVLDGHQSRAAVGYLGGDAALHGIVFFLFSVVFFFGLPTNPAMLESLTQVPLHRKGIY